MAINLTGPVGRGGHAFEPLTCVGEEGIGSFKYITPVPTVFLFLFLVPI